LSSVNHVEIAGLTLTNSQLAPNQAQSFLVCENVARSFNVITSQRQFSVIGAASGDLVTFANFGVDLNSAHIGSNNPNILTDQIDAASQIFNRSATYRVRRKRMSITEREKKKEQSKQLSFRQGSPCRQHQ